METLALFSLEVVIEKLYLPGVTCRIPSIVCKLLDFPTVTIDIIDAKSADKMRKTLTADPLWTIPSQLDCLKDLQDTFIFKRGKSCLFKMSPENLIHHLCNVPLYLLVLDSFPDTPKLLGSVSLPLDTAVKRICSEFEEDRFNVPKVFANKGLLRIYNLMGKEVGYMTAGYRLLCLGSTLLIHLTETEHRDTADAVNNCSTNENPCESNVNTKKSVEIQTDITNTDRQYSRTTVNSDKPESEHETVNSDAEVQSNITAEKDVSVYLCEPSEGENLIENNIENIENSGKTHKSLECIKETSNEETFFEHYLPPPMLYHNDGKPSFHIPLPSDEELNQLYMNKADGESDISKEDIQCDFRRYQHAKSGSSSPLLIAQSNTNNENNFENNFPLLTGILKELSSIDIPSLANQICSGIKQQNPSKNYLSEGTQTIKRDRAQQMKKTRNWIRNTPQITNTKSLLAYGLTKTYTLRLEKLRSQKEASAKKSVIKTGRKARFVNISKNVSDTKNIMEEKQPIDTFKTPGTELETGGTEVEIPGTEVEIPGIEVETPKPEKKAFKMYETITIKAENKFVIKEGQVVHLEKDDNSLKEESIITSLSIEEKKSIQVSQTSILTAGSRSKNDEEHISNTDEEIPNIENETESSEYSQIEDFKSQMKEKADSEANSVSNDPIRESDGEDTSTIETVSSEEDTIDKEITKEGIIESLSRLERMKSSTDDHDNISVDSKLSQIAFPTDKSSKRIIPMLNRESTNTESVSSYKPSDENIWPHTSGDQVEYSDDFSSSSSNSEVNTEQLKNILRSENKLGYTIW